MTNEQYKSNFKKALTVFAEKLQQHVSTENGEWSVKGFIDVYKNIYTIDEYWINSGSATMLKNGKTQ